MSNRGVLAPLIVILIGGLAALPCTLSKRPIWAKDPRSSSSLFRVVVGGRAGYIDGTGRMAIAPKFDPYYVEPTSGDFLEGVALVSVSEARGFIDESGKVLNFDGLKVSDSYSGSLTVATRSSEPGRILIVDRAGRVVATVNALWVGPFSEELAAIAENTSGRFNPNAPFGHRRGYIDPRGNIVIAPKFAYTGPFAEGLAAVAEDGRCWVSGWGGSQFPAPSAPVQLTGCGPLAADSVTRPCHHGYIEKTGRWIIPARYELAQDFAHNRAGVRVRGKWGFIDRTGAEIAPFRFDEVRPFSDDRAAVREGDKWGYIG